MNIMLNSYRRFIDTDINCYDCFLHDCPLLKSNQENGNIEVLLTNGETNTFQGPAIISSFPYGNTSEAIQDIVKTMNLQTNLTDDFGEIEQFEKKILSNKGMLYNFGLPKLFNSIDDISNEILLNILITICTG